MYVLFEDTKAVFRERNMKICKILHKINKDFDICFATLRQNSLMFRMNFLFR